MHTLDAAVAVNPGGAAAARSSICAQDVMCGCSHVHCADAVVGQRLNSAVWGAGVVMMEIVNVQTVIQHTCRDE